MINYRNKAGLKLLEKTIFEYRTKDLELSFSASCDKSCYYCYLKDYGDKLYPPVPTNQILSNLEKLLNWLYENNYLLIVWIFFRENFLLFHTGKTFLELY